MNKFEETLVRSHEHYMTRCADTSLTPEYESVRLHYRAKADAFEFVLAEYRRHKSEKTT
jgi:hypothetical protein